MLDMRTLRKRYKPKRSYESFGVFWVELQCGLERIHVVIGFKTP